MLRQTLTLAALALATVAWPALAHMAQQKSIEVQHPWVRALPAGGRITAGYAKITNTGAEADRLLSASLDGAGKAELHETLNDNGVYRMRPAPGGVEIPAGGTVTLATGGLHIMFLEVAKPLEEETYVKGSLTFEKAGKLDLDFFVEPVGGKKEPAGGPASEQHH